MWKDLKETSEFLTCDNMWLGWSVTTEGTSVCAAWLNRKETRLNNEWQRPARPSLQTRCMFLHRCESWAGRRECNDNRQRLISRWSLYQRCKLSVALKNGGKIIIMSLSFWHIQVMTSVSKWVYCSIILSLTLYWKEPLQEEDETFTTLQ